jgi:hypothetical protein
MTQREVVQQLVLALQKAEDFIRSTHPEAKGLIQVIKKALDNHASSLIKVPKGKRGLKK